MQDNDAQYLTTRELAALCRLSLNAFYLAKYRDEKAGIFPAPIKRTRAGNLYAVADANAYAADLLARRKASALAKAGALVEGVNHG